MKKRGPKGPSKYKKEYCKKLIEFFDIDPYEDKEMKHFGKDGELKWVDYKRVANRLPTIRNFAKKIKVDFTTLYDWIKKYEEFSHAFTQAKEIRKWFLIENGLNNCYNPAFAIFVAKNITDMRDKQEVEHSGEITIPTIKNATNKELARIIKEGLDARSRERASKEGTREKKAK